MRKWTKKFLVDYLRKEDWLSKGINDPIPEEVKRALPKILKTLNKIK